MTARPRVEWDESGPSADEYIELRRQGELSARSRECAARGLAGSLFALVGRIDGHAVAMGRVIGDGGTIFDVVDVVVTPTFQGQGVGSEVMRRITRFLDDNALPTAVVTLLADVPADRLYAKFGFAPTAPTSIGMIRRITP